MPCFTKLLVVAKASHDSRSNDIFASKLHCTLAQALPALAGALLGRQPRSCSAGRENQTPNPVKESKISNTTFQIPIPIPLRKESKKPKYQSDTGKCHALACTHDNVVTRVGHVVSFKRDTMRYAIIAVQLLEVKVEVSTRRSLPGTRRVGGSAGPRSATVTPNEHSLHLRRCESEVNLQYTRSLKGP